MKYAKKWEWNLREPGLQTYAKILATNFTTQTGHPAHAKRMVRLAFLSRGS